MTLIEAIRESHKGYNSQTVFSYGRAADTTLTAAKIEIDQWFVHLDPVSTDGTTPDSNLSTPLAFGILRQDVPDSEYDQAQELAITDSIEKIQAEAETFALGWMDYFLDNYGRKYSIASFNISPATRVKNVMSGILFRVTLIYKRSC